MGSLNIDRGFFAKEGEINDVLCELNLDVLFLQEIELRDFCPGQIHFPGYLSFVNDQSHKRTCTLIKEKAFKQVIQLDCPDSLPHVMVSIEEFSGRKTTLLNVYREWSRGTAREELEDLIRTISYQSSKGRLIVGGDFNLDTAKTDDTGYGLKNLLNNLLDNLQISGLDRTCFGPTFQRVVQGILIQSNLDWVVSNIETHDQGNRKLGFSDHSLITWKMEGDGASSPKDTGFVSLRNLKKINKEKFAIDLACQPWENLESLPADSAATELNNMFLRVLDRHAPLEKVQCQPKVTPRPSTELKKLRRDRDNARSKGNQERLRSLRNRCKSLAKKESVSFYQKMFSGGANKRTWGVINGVLGKSKQNNANIVLNDKTLSPNEAASAFNDFFITKIENLKKRIESPNCDTFSGTRKRAKKLSLKKGSLSLKNIEISDSAVKKILSLMKPSSCPDIYGISPNALKLCPEILCVPLTLVIQKALAEEKFPQPWKTARVIPVHKKDARTSLANYRPISILPTFSKVLETVIKNSLTDYLEKNKILPASQFGFRRGLSTQDAIIATEHDFKKAKINKLSGGALLFDLSAAFDTINLEILIEKLHIYGADDSFLSMIASYLTNRYQKVTYQNSDSGTKSLDTGTPQGSILSPILFLTLVSDIEEWLTLASLLSYADDNTIFAFAPSKEEVLDILRHEAKVILRYMAAMKLAANPQKTKFILFGKCKADPLQVGDVMIPESNEVTILGVTFNKLLNWSSQTKKLEAKLRQKTGLLRRLSKKLPVAVTKSLVQPIFVANLLHSLPVIANPNKIDSTLFQSLHHLHRQAMKSALGLSRAQHPPDSFLFSNTNQFPVSNLANYLAASMACKTLTSWQTHPLTKSRISDHPGTRQTRQNDRVLPPQLVDSTLSNLVESFVRVPPAIRGETNLNSKKKRLKLTYGASVTQA